MFITKEYIKGNYSFVGTSLENIKELLKDRELKVEDYVIMEFGQLYYATHKECFTVEYYNEYQESY